MTPYIAANIYATCAALPIAMQIALACGTPIGRFANGGRFPNALPPLWRGFALVQGALLVAMAWSMLARGEVINAQVTPTALWMALGITVLTTLANMLSPSRPERLLWTPVTIVMTASALCVVFF